MPYRPTRQRTTSRSRPTARRPSSDRPPRRRNRRSQRRKTKRRSGAVVKGAQQRLKRFAQASILTVAVTGFLVLLLAPSEAGYSQDADTVGQDVPDSVAVIEKIATEELTAEEAEADTLADAPGDVGEAAKNEALVALRNLWDSFYENLPKILVALAALLLAGLLVRLLKALLHRTIGGWKNSGGIITLVTLSLWLLAIGVAVSVLAGDIRALIGSLGLVGLALSWSLQTPIESFTGWLINSFEGYYRVGDRVSVGEVFGDVYKIDFLTTTVWEIGAPYRDGFVQAEQPTGRMVTFPNNEILSGTVVNLTGDFPYVWDELAVAVANESNLTVSMEVVRRVANELLGEYMKKPAAQYEQILRGADLEYAIATEPEVYVSLNESWTDIVVRYLVGARERRKWKSQLSLRVMEELNRLEHKSDIKSVYPRQQVQFVNADGDPDEVTEIKKEKYRGGKNGEK